MLVRQKTRFTVFSSEDSKNTDNSLGSSLEVEESNAQASHANKFNQLRETMNQIFLANPELADEIKFDKYLTDDEPDPIRNFGIPTSPLRRGIGNGGDPYQGMLDEPGTELASGKFWSTISKEMTKAQKNSKAPTLNQINHVLNIFKGNWEKQDDNTSYNPIKSPSAPKKSKSEFRIQSTKGGEKQTSPVKKEGKGAGLNQQYSSMGGQDESEDGMKYYSFRKKLHLKLKHKRIEREMEELARKKELDAEKEKLAKELEERQMLSTLAGLDQEIKKGMVQKEGEEGEGTLKKEKKKKEPQSRRNSSKPKGDIFERLTKDMTKNVVIEEEENQTKRKFVSEFAEDLYKDLKAIGDAEVFKKVAQTKIANRKKEWKERLAKQKLPFNEALRFTKNKSRYLNMFVPEAEKIGQGQNKDAVFVVNEVQKDSEEWKLNFENEVLAKIKKIKQGNILEFWQEVKDINQ